MKWKADSNETYRTIIGEMDIRIHRWVHEKDKWFLSVRNSPLFFDRYPLLELDIEGAKKEAINIIFEKANDIQTALCFATKRDKKKIDSFKLRLVAILNDVETIHECKGNKVWELEPQFNKLIKTIQSAMSDL